MKTVKTYMVRKPSNIEEVLSVSTTIVRDCSFRVEEVMISETINLTRAQYKKICEIYKKNLLIVGFFNI